jgi:hypothetical protein
MYDSQNSYDEYGNPKNTSGGSTGDFSWDFLKGL